MQPAASAREVRRQFGIGVRRCVARGVWLHIQEVWYPGHTLEQIALELGFESPSSVSRGLQHGELSLEGLCVLLTRAGRAWADLPALPDQRARVLHGYRQAMAYALGRVAQSGPGPLEVLCLMRLYARRDRWGPPGSPAPGGDVAVTVVAEALEAGRGLPLGARPPADAAAYLAGVNREWGPAYLQVVRAVGLGASP